MTKFEGRGWGLQSRPSVLGTLIYEGIKLERGRILVHTTRWFKYDRDYLCVNKSQFVPVIFEPPCIYVQPFPPQLVFICLHNTQIIV
jgi:hypothetical protein